MIYVSEYFDNLMEEQKNKNAKYVETLEREVRSYFYNLADEYFKTTEAKTFDRHSYRLEEKLITKEFLEDSKEVSKIYKKTLLLLRDKLIEYDKSGNVHDTFYYRRNCARLDYLEFAMYIKKRKYEFESLFQKNPILKNGYSDILHKEKFWKDILNSILEYIKFDCFVNERIQLYIALDIIEEMCYNSPTEYNYWRKNYIMSLFSKPKKEIKKIAKNNSKHMDLLSDEEKANLLQLYLNVTGWINMCKKSDKLTEEHCMSLINYAINIIGEDLQSKYLLYMFSNNFKDLIEKDVKKLLPYDYCDCATGEKRIINVADVCAISIPNLEKKHTFLEYFEHEVSQELMDGANFIYFPYINLMFVYDGGNHRLAREICEKRLHIKVNVYDFKKMFDRVDLLVRDSNYGNETYDKNGNIYKQITFDDSYWLIRKNPDEQPYKEAVADIRFALLFAFAKKKYEMEEYFKEKRQKEAEENEHIKRLNRKYTDELEEYILSLIKTQKEGTIVEIYDIAKRAEIRQECVRIAMDTEKGKNLVHRKLAVKCWYGDNNTSECLFDSLNDIPTANQRMYCLDDCHKRYCKCECNKADDSDNYKRVGGYSDEQKFRIVYVRSSEGHSAL